MSLIENLKRGVGRPPVPTGPEQAPPIAAKIAAAEAQLSALLAEHPEAALDAVQGRDGAEQRLADLNARIAEVERRLAVLRPAHDAALAADQRMFAAQRAALRSAQIAAVRRHLKARDEAGIRCSAAVENAVAAFGDTPVCDGVTVSPIHAKINWFLHSVTAGSQVTVFCGFQTPRFAGVFCIGARTGRSFIIDIDAKRSRRRAVRAYHRCRPAAVRCPRSRSRHVCGLPTARQRHGSPPSLPIRQRSPRFGDKFDRLDQLPSQKTGGGVGVGARLRVAILL